MERLFKYLNEIDPTMFHTYKKGLSPTINNKKIILHHPKGWLDQNYIMLCGLRTNNILVFMRKLAIEMPSE